MDIIVSTLLPCARTQSTLAFLVLSLSSNRTEAEISIVNLVADRCANPIALPLPLLRK